MILTLEEAKELDQAIEQDDLDAFEQSVRALTNNTFQNTRVRYENVVLEAPNKIIAKETIKGVKKGDTVEVNYSPYASGLYVVDEIDGNEIKLSTTLAFSDDTSGIMLTLVSYPADIKKGIKGLISYDKKMAGKVGIKSETISRMSITYYDVTATENTDGYPSNLLSFLKKYQKMRW